jgi:hypothetical protein
VPSLEIGLEDFGMKDIVCTGDVEAMLIIESVLIWCGSTTTCEITIGGIKGKCFGTNPSSEDK